MKPNKRIWVTCASKGNSETKKKLCEFYDN